MGHAQVIEWKKTLRVGDTIDVLHQGFWHEAVIRSVPVQTSNPYAYSYASWSVGLTAFDGRLVNCGRYDRPMAPRGMFVGDWRASLAVGDRVEARLDDNTWAMARVTAAADADEEEAKPAPAPARGGGVDICLVVIAGERFESSLEAGGVVNKGAEYRTLVRDTETFGSLRRTLGPAARPAGVGAHALVAARPRAGAGAGVVVAPRQARLVGRRQAQRHDRPGARAGGGHASTGTARTRRPDRPRVVRARPEPGGHGDDRRHEELRCGDDRGDRPARADRDRRRRDEAGAAAELAAAHARGHALQEPGPDQAQSPRADGSVAVWKSTSASGAQA